jgi:uncharacterized protein (TIGR03435 family)
MVTGIAQKSHCGSKPLALPLHSAAPALLCTYVLLLAFLAHVSAHAQQPTTTSKLPAFEVATVRPSRPDDRGRRLRTSADRITIENFSLKELIVYAWNLKDNSQVLDGPDWLDKSHFDIAAVASEAEVTKLRTLSADDQRQQWSEILQPLLAERFQLSVRPGTQTMPVYELVVAKAGPKLKPASASDGAQNTLWDNGRLTWTATSMESLAYYLTRIEGRVVLDCTGLSGRYDFAVGWPSDENTSSDTYAADLLAAMREQLGLDLKSARE